MMRRAFSLALVLSISCLMVSTGQAERKGGPLAPLLSEEETAEVPLIGFERLITFLPEVPLRWKAEAPTGNTVDNATLRLTTVRRVYYQGEGGDEDAKVVITLIDSTDNRDYFEVSDSRQWLAAEETPDGYDRRVEIDGMRAFEHYSKANHTSSLSVFVGQRYFVQVELTNGDPKGLKEWFKRIDIQRLATLK